MSLKIHSFITEIATWFFFALLALGLALPLALKEHHLDVEDLLAPPLVTGELTYGDLFSPDLALPMMATALTPQEVAALHPEPTLLRDLALKRRPRLTFNESLAEYDAMIEQAARQHQVSAVLVKAVIQAESGFDSAVVSHRGAVGLMQVMPATGRSLGVHDLTDPGKNIQAGVKYLKFLLKLFNDDERLAIAAYNCGPEAMKRFNNQIPPFRETQAFVERVMAYYNQNLKS